MVTAAAIATPTRDSEHADVSQQTSSRVQLEPSKLEPTPLSASRSPTLDGPRSASPMPSTSATKLVATKDISRLPSESASVKNDATEVPQSMNQIDGKQSSSERDEDALLLASLASSPLNDNALGTSIQALQGDTILSPIKEEDPFSLPPAMTADEDASGPIQAYAKLEFPGFSYYIQTLECTIGRRPAHMRTPPGKEGESQHITGAAKLKGDIDVDLGLLKSISRLHVRIYYQEKMQAATSYPPGMFDYAAGDANGSAGGRFVLQVLGRNGCFVDDVPVGKDVVVPLGKRTKIQIAERVFYFVLPPPPSKRRYNSDGELDSDASLHDSDEEDEEEDPDEEEEEEESGSLGSSDSGEEESQPSEDEEEKAISKEDVDKKIKTSAKSKVRPRLILKKKESSASKGGKGKHQGKTVWPGQGKTTAEKRARGEEEELQEDGNEGAKGGKGSSKKARTSATDKDAIVVAAPKKRKRVDQPEVEKNGTLKVGAPIGIEALGEIKKRRRKKKGEADEEGAHAETKTNTIASEIPAGRGKSGGKALVAAAAVAAKAKAEEGKAKAKGIAASATLASNTSIRPRPLALNATMSSARPFLATNHEVSSGVAQPGASLSRTPGSMSVATNRPLPASTPSNAYRASLSTQRPPSVAMSAVPRPLSNGVAPSANFSPTPASHSTVNAPSSTTPRKQASVLPTNSAATSTSTPLPPAGPGIKPELSKMDLIRNALANPTSMSRGGKLTLQEICEDISSRYEWYRNNSRANGRDWHSTMRHAVGNSKEMMKIPRKGSEQGKGAFYAFKSSPAAQMYKKETEMASNGYSPTQTVAMSASPTPPLMTARPAPGVSNGPAIVSTPSNSSSGTSVQRPTTSQAAGISTPIRPRPPVQAIGRPLPPVQATGRVSIVIGKAPAEALAHMAATPKAPITLNIEALFGGPPIVHHEGKLYLSPQVFGHMSSSQISDIGGKGAQQALAILQSHLVSHLQGKLKNTGSSAPVAGGSAAKLPSPSNMSSNVSSTATLPRSAASAPSIQQRPRPSPPPPPKSNGDAAVAQRPPAHNSNVKATQAAVAPATRPQVVASPMSTPSQSKPLINSNSVRPAIAGASSIQRPMSNPVRPSARPTAHTVRPLQGQVAAPTAPNGRIVDSGTRPPMAAPAPVAYAARPANVGLPAVGSSTPRSSGQDAASDIVRPAMPSIAGTAASSPRLQANGAHASSSIATSATDSKKSLPANSVAPSTSSNAPSSNAMMTAMKALASHPDSAGLMTLLSGGKVNNASKLTPGQLDLLQQAGRLAAEQQKVQSQQQQKTLETPSKGNAQPRPPPPSSATESTGQSPISDDTKAK